MFICFDGILSIFYYCQLYQVLILEFKQFASRILPFMLLPRGCLNSTQLKPINAVHNNHCSISCPEIYKIRVCRSFCSNVLRMGNVYNTSQLYYHLFENEIDEKGQRVNFSAIKSDYLSSKKSFFFFLFRCSAEPKIQQACEKRLKAKKRRVL